MRFLCCSQDTATTLFLLLNLWLAVFSGATLSTAARLKWDPSAYVPLRELFPEEYRRGGVSLAALAGASLLLPHAGLLASLPRRRPWLLWLYCALALALVAGELCWAVWLARLLSAWLGSQDAGLAEEALGLREHLKPLLAFLGRFHPLPDRIQEIMQEVEEDLPQSAYVALACASSLLALQVAAAALALAMALSGRRRARSQTRSTSTLISRGSNASSNDERAPLRTTFRGGKLVII